MANTNPYLTFSSPSSFTLATANSAKNWDGTLEYSTDLFTWTTWTGTSAISSGAMNNENVLYIRGTNNTYITGDNPIASSHMWQLEGNNISCTGNIENLLDYTTVFNNNHPSMAAGCFRDLFNGCTGLIEAPKFPATTLAARCYGGTFGGCINLVKAPELPATSLKEECYYYMFYDCTSLTTPPELPATTLVTRCYQNMFQDCTSLKLSVTKTENYLISYRIPSSGTGITATDALLSMFANTGGTFTGTPDINTTYYLWVETYPDRALKFSSTNSFTLATANSTKNWNGELEYSIDLANWDVWDGTTILNSSNSTEHVLYLRGTGNSYITKGGMREQFLDGTNIMVMSPDKSKGWTLAGSNISCTGNIENLLDYQMVAMSEHPSMSANCYDYMFYNCTSLITPPELPATMLTESCYFGMFNDCINLTIAPKLPATTLAVDCYAFMFSGCTSLTTVPELPATTLAFDCYYYMFQGCTSLTTASELPATMLVYGCYQGMFFNCTSLTTAPNLLAATLADYCCVYMFNGCTSLITPPGLTATTLAEGCYAHMFSGCTSLKTAPELPAITLAEACYYDMFADCTSLAAAPELPATTLAWNCYARMFYNCTSLVKAPELPATTLAVNCYGNMFENTGFTISETKTSATSYPYRIPFIGDGTTATDALTDMFSGVTGNIPTPEINKTYYLSHRPIGGLKVNEVKKDDEVIDIKHYHIYTDSTLTENAYTDSAFGAEALYDAYKMTDTEYNTLIALID